jgi:hypothetical protein
MPISSSPVLEATRTHTDLSLLPYPRVLTLRGAPFRPAPSSYLYLSTNATTAVRRRAHALCKQFEALKIRTTLSSAAALLPTQAIFTPAATFQKWDQMSRPLRGDSLSREGYRLLVSDEGVLLHGNDEEGLMNAGKTLRQLLEDGHEVPGLEIEDHPLLPYRAMHLDFKGWPPKFDYLKWVVETLANLKINVILLEYEAAFNFPSQPGLAHHGALTPDEVGELDVLATDLGVTLIPLVPCLGNMGHVLRLPEYASLREHPDFYQQFCPVNPSSIEIVTAMMEDLVNVHQGKWFHMGGDDTRLLGSNPASEQRAKQLGGRSALYLEYIGRVARYLMHRGKHPLIWDDMFRKMSDEQIKWLPPEAILTFWQYEGAGGKATPAILTGLDRYKKLGREVWGAATRTPSIRYDSFDNIDAWTDASEMGLLTGLITTAWTRDYSLGPLQPPPETAWPGAFYASERVWSGLKMGPDRSSFPQRFIARMFGVKDHAHQASLWSGFDLLLREYPRRARDYFAQGTRHCSRNKETLEFLYVWANIGSFKEYVNSFASDIANNYFNLQGGHGDPFNCGRLRWRVQDLKTKLPLLMRHFTQYGGRLTHDSIVREFLESIVAFNLRRLDEMDSLLSTYPLPPAEWQQPVAI